MTQPTPPANHPFSHLVCIGASAGGLDALEKFFHACPPNTGAAFVVVQHLSPDHKSMMSNLLARHTSMPVTTVEDDMAIEGNHVYLIPPGVVMHVTPGHLHLTPKNPHGLSLPIDIFFASMAEVYGKQAVGIVLSGTGSDGTRGAQAIRSAGGLLLVQDPDLAKFDGMPRSVIAAGSADAVLATEELPLRLVAHMTQQPYEQTKLDIARTGFDHLHESDEEALAAILRLVQQHCGIDFAEYKQPTVMRRIERRMQVRHTPSIQQYHELLDNDRSEVITLRRDMLIPVTSFFRDTEAFQTLADKVIAPMVQNKDPGDTIRVWIAGTATGEEAYTVGMLFVEAFERLRRWPNLKIFATDVDQQCIETAGMGQYPETSATEVSAERRERFFTQAGERLVVKSELRQFIVFARHNLLVDPPFTKMDLVLCRNTLIYFKNVAQERALRSLHYALVQGGVLMLGSSESLSPNSEGLEPLSSKHKVFRCVSPVAPTIADRSSGFGGLGTIPPRHAHLHRTRRRSLDVPVGDEGAAALLQAFAPPSMLVNPQQEAVHLYGEVNMYLQPRQGAASLEVNRLLPEGLMPVASALLYKVQRDRVRIESDVVETLLSTGERQRVRLSALPVNGPDDEPMALLCFHRDFAAPPAAPVGEAINVDAETIARIGTLERELAATRESLQATIEELETSNEELQATNEELMASNEELQSSNEELQSVNEEMSTVNAEFQEKMLILNRANADLDSMAKAAGVATIFVDQELHITRFSPDATSIFKLKEGDVGRRLDDFAHKLHYPELMDDLALTLRTERMVEREVTTLDKTRTYLLRILPYLIPSTTMRGAVATFVDVTAFHDAQRLQAIIDGLAEHIAVLDPTGTIVMVNAAWERFAKANGDADMTVSGPGCNYLSACKPLGVPGGDVSSNGGEAARGIRQVLEGSLPQFSLEYPCHSPTEERWFVMNVAPIRVKGLGAVVSHVNVTPWYTRKT